MTSRRDFLKSGLAAGAAAPFAGARLAPSWLHDAGSNAAEPILVILQVAGGYDLFNMLVPANHPVYQAARPGIGIPAGSTLGEIAPGSGLYWAPALAAFKTLFDAGDLAAILNVGYPQPNLSHFESEKIWYAGDRALPGSGWLGRYLLNAYPGNSPMPAIAVDSTLSPSFNPARVPVLLNSDTFGMTFDAQSPADNALEKLAIRVNSMWLRPTPHPNLAFLAQATVAAMDSSEILQAIGSGYTPRVQYPNSALARAFQLAARYVTGGLPSHVYYLRTGGFDNHANLATVGNPVAGTLATRIGDVTNSVKAFYDDMQAHNLQRPLLIMLWSEFSRRLGENSSYGSDHGHGGVAFLLGQSVNGGLYGTYPDLAQARTPYATWYPPFNAQSTDFRSVYATVLERWLNVPHAPVLGGTYPLINAI